MTSGLVNERLEAIVAVAVIGPMKRQDVDVVIDTGFTGYLTLTSEKIGALDLRRVGALPGKLANGAEIEFAAYAAKMVWNEEEIEIAVIESAGGNLLGTACWKTGG